MTTKVNVVMAEEVGGGNVPRIWPVKVFFNYEEAWEYSQMKNDVHLSAHYYVVEVELE